MSKVLIRCVKDTPQKADLPSEHARFDTKGEIEAAWQEWRSRSMDAKYDNSARARCRLSLRKIEMVIDEWGISLADTDKTERQAAVDLVQSFSR